MLRSAGFNLLAQPISDVFLAQVSAGPVSHGGAVYPAKGPAA
jgi:hypothetical protein